MNPTRSLRSLTVAAALFSASAASAVTILSVEGELYGLTDPRNYVDIWVRQSPDPWKDRIYSVAGDPGMLRVQGDNQNVPFYLIDPPKTDQISVYWNNEWNTDWDFNGGSAWADFTNRTVTVSPWGNPMDYFYYQFYGDAVRLIWSNDATEPTRVPDGASTALMLVLPAAVYAYIRRRRPRLMRSDD